MAARTTDTGNTLTPVGRAEAAVAEQLSISADARKAWVMRQNGATFFQIAEELSISEHAAAKTVREVADHVAELIDVGAKQEILVTELTRLDRLQAGIFTMAEAGDMRALDGVLKIMAHRAKLLGLDQVTVDNRKQTVVIAGDSDSYLSAIEQAMGGSS